MKNKIDRFKIKTSRFSIRSIAVVLCFVMLLTAIGSGSVLSAIAAGVNRPTVASAVKTVVDGANVDEAILQKKGDLDLADTGAEADLAASSYDFTSGKVIYFDNSWTQWTNVYLRVGKTDYSSAYAMTKVSGTNNIYSYTIPSWGGYAAFAVANNSGWTGSNNSIYSVDTGDKYDITASTNYLTFNVTSDIMIVPKSTNNTSEGCQYYNVCGVGNATASTSSASTFTTLNKSVSVASVDNGTVTAAYTTGTGGTIAEGGNASILYGSTLTVSQSPSTGYTAGSYTGTCINNKSSDTVANGTTCYVGYRTTPTTACSITGSFSKIKYTVSKADTSNGSFTLSPSATSQAWGTEITVTPSPDPGYELDKITYKAGSSSAEDITSAKKFTMPEADTTVTVTFKKSIYDITQDTITGEGTISIDKSTAQIDDTITVTCYPATGYKISTVKFGHDTATQDGSDENKWTYTLTASNVGDKTVTAEFAKEDYTITKPVSPESSGSISVTKDGSEVINYNIGDSLTLTATPADHYTFKNFTVTGATTATLTTNPATLSMSGKTGPVTITANFDETVYKGISYSGKYSTTGEDDSYTNNLDGLLFDEAVSGTNQDGITLTAPTATGYTFYKWVSSGGTITNATSTTNAVFKPTADNQTVTALYKKNYTVAATAGLNGDLTSTTTYPATQTVAAGDTASFEFTPDAGYGISSILVNLVDKLDRVRTEPYVFTTEKIKSDTTVQASFAPAITVNAAVSDTNKARNASSADRFHYGTGTVQINGGTADDSTASAVVTTGSNVTFTATPDSGWGFGGWYAEETCETLVSSQPTMTVPVTEAGKTYYAAFIEDHYYLVGEFYLADYAKYHKEGHSSTNFRLTPDSNNPGLFTYEDDFMFKQYTENSSNIYHLQYVSVSWGSESNGMYSTDKRNAESDYPSSGIAVNNDDCWKWRIGEETGEFSNSYQHVKITWDAINEKLSWTITPIDMSEYTVIYLKADNTWTWDHVYATNLDRYIKIMGIPSVTLDGGTYNQLIIKNSTLGTDELHTKFHKSSGDSYATGGTNESDEFAGMYAGGVYKFNLGTSDWGPFNQDHYFLSGQYANGDAGFFTTASASTAAQMKQMTEGNTGIFSWETPDAAATTADGCIPTGVIQFKVYKNADSEDAAHKASYPEYAQSYRIKSNITKLKFSYNCADHSITVTPTYKEQPWYYSGTAAADRTAVNPTDGMTAFDNTQTGDGKYGKFRFMWGKTDPALDNALEPSYYSTGTASNAFWADITSSYGTDYTGNFYIGLCNYGNKGNLVGNKNTEINDSQSDKEIKDTSNKTLFHIQEQENNNVSGSASYILIRGVDWTRVSAIGIRAYDNSKATNNTNPHGDNGKVDYQIFYRPAAPEEEDPVPEPGTVKTVDIYAKDATLRSDTFNRFANLADTTIDLSTFEFTDPGTGTVYSSVEAYNSGYADAKGIDPITAVDTTHHTTYGAAVSPDRGAGYEVVENVPVGAKIKIKTQLATTANALSFNNKAFDQTHYLKAYSYNGATYELHKPSDMDNGLVQEVWTVRDVNTFRDVEDSEDKITLMKNQKTIEITPIYYLQDNTNTRTFYIEGYDGTVQQAWGNMLSVYPYYEGKSNKENAFGGYPGQPMLLWGGKYQMEVPLTVDGTASGATVKGLTLHNGYWDLLHRDLDVIAGQQHAQTYDFDDFYKLNKEKNPDSIIFDFKYFSKADGKDNFGDGYNYTKYNFADGYAVNTMERNAEENLTDYYNRPVDAFGTVLTAEEADDPHLTFVSTGYKDTYVGEYATIWAVYKPDDTFLGYISSSMLYLNNISRVSQYTDGTNTAEGKMSWSQFINTYNTLKSTYTKTPVKISYEKELWNDSKDKANRSDGRWYYSKNTDKVSANIKIQYGPATLIDKADKSLSSNAWKEDAFDASKTGVGGEHNIGSVTGCSAYFTNTTPVNLNGKTESGSVFSDTTKYFNFKAQASGSYIFAGWVRLNNGKYYEISESEIGQSNMSANDTYIARFVEAKAGTLIVSHDVEQTDVFKGTGTPSITVLIKNGSTTVDTLTNNKGENIDLTKYIKTAYRNYTIDISLSTNPDDETESYMKEIISSAGNFAATPATFNTGSGSPSTETVNATVKQFTVNDILDSGVTNLRYVSHLMKPEYHYSYDITYTYNSRFYGEQSYTVSGTFDAVGKPASAGNMTGAKTTAKLTDDFIINQTPYEKNFREKINWNYTDAVVGDASAMVNNAAELDPSVSNTYKMTAHVYSANTVDDSVKAEFLLPYKHKDKANGYKADPLKEYSNNQVISENEYIFDESQESVTVKTQAYGLFTYADKEDADDLNLIEAAPYVWKNTTKHTVSEEKVRYFTGTYFTIGNTNYWYSAVPAVIPAEAQQAAANNVAVTENTVVNNWNGKDYTWSVLDSENATLYSFSEDGNHGQYTRHTYEDTVDGFVAGSGTKKYFTRWDIFNSDGDLVANGYSRFFNFTGYENYLIKAVYESDKPAQTGTSPEGTMATITYLGDTRNQWNNGNCGNYNGKAETKEASDELYADFAIAYRYNGEQIDQIDSSTPIKTGMIIERMGAVEKIGDTMMTDIFYYVDKYKNTADESTVNDIKTALESNHTNDDSSINSALRSALSNPAMNSRIGANVEGWGSEFGAEASDATTKMKFNSVIDNFNRLQWCYNFKNNKSNPDDKTSVKNAKYVFRAWSYIIVNDTATVSSTPAYFTFYDTAVR